MKASKVEKQELTEEVERLLLALKDSKADCEALQDEIEELTQAFDETAIREKQQSDGQHDTLKELLATRSREVDELKEELKNLADANTSLSIMLKDTEENMKKFHEEKVRKQQKVANESASSSKELTEAENKIKDLEASLEGVRTELAEQQNEVERVRSTLEGKISQVQKDLETAEGELEATRSKLYEMEKNPKKDETTPRRNIVRLTHSSTLLLKDVKRQEECQLESVFYRSHALSRRLHSHKLRNRPRSCSPTTIQRLEGDAEQRVAVARSLRHECDRLEDQNRMSVSMKTHLEEEIKQLKMQFVAGINVEDKFDPESDLYDMEDTIEDILQSKDFDKIAEEYRSLSKKVSSQKAHNAELLTRILKLQGNIQVCCRIRPMSIGESQKGLHEVAQSLSETEVGCFDERTQRWKSYAFDKVWGPETRQNDIFHDVEPMAMSVVDGYNACIFAYGQTGSGKTYTMEGENGRYGISQRTIQKVFGMLQDRAKEQHKKNLVEGGKKSFEYFIEVGMLEIYNDEGKLFRYSRL
jgi:kinesin family protein C2/C3